MAVPEDIKQFLIGNLGRVVVYLYRFAVVTDTVISGVWRGASRVADAGANNALGAPEPGVWTPESAQGKRCHFRLGRRGGVNGWDAPNGNDTGFG